MTKSKTVSIPLNVVRLEPEAILPTKAHPTDAGYDLYALEDMLLPKGEVTKVHTGIAIQFPERTWGLLRDRSSVATKSGLFVVAGVIDQDYRGEIVVALYNSRGAQRITPGMKIAQLVLMELFDCPVVEIPAFPDETVRGTNGFGSSGS